MKPLHEIITGTPLISQAVRFAEEFGADDLVTVTNPVNNDAICADHAAMTVVQPEPFGVVDAIARGMERVRGAWTLLLCSDNAFEPGGDYFASMVDFRGGAIATNLSLADPDRYSGFNPFRGELIARELGRDGNPRWCGPALVRSDALRIAVERFDCAPLEAVLNYAGAPFRMIPMSCVDLGVTKKEVVA